MIRVSGAGGVWPPPPLYGSVCLGLFGGSFGGLAGFSVFFGVVFATELLLNGP